MTKMDSKLIDPIPKANSTFIKKQKYYLLTSMKGISKYLQLSGKEPSNSGIVCGSVGRAVASKSRGSRFESHHWQKFILNILLSTVLKRRKSRKRGREWPIFKNHRIASPIDLVLATQ